jgi:hypothetical protein
MFPLLSTTHDQGPGVYQPWLGPFSAYCSLGSALTYVYASLDHEFRTPTCHFR